MIFLKLRICENPSARTHLECVYEIQYGIAKSENSQKKKIQFEKLLSECSVLPFTSQEAHEAASIRAALEKLGTPIGPYDVLIAATARANNLTLITHNSLEFKRVKGLTIKDWF